MTSSCRRHSARAIFLLATFGAGVASAAPQAVVLFDNGPFITGNNNAPDGSNTSAVQTSVGLTATGFAAAPGSATRLADDFTIPPGAAWIVSRLELYAFQPDTSAAALTITGVSLRIWNGPPDNVASTVVFGNTTGNFLSSRAYAGTYRVVGSLLGDTRRPIVQLTLDLPSIVLAPGTYWIDWQATGSATVGGPYTPPVTRPGNAGSGNAKQFVGGQWTAVVDGTNAQSLPLHVIGDVDTLGRIFSDSFE